MPIFDKDKFAQLLDLAKGDRSINQYSLISGVSAAHISRLLRGLLDTPPSPEIIKKLSDRACNDITYYELMDAAGHISGHYEKQHVNPEEVMYTEYDENGNLISQLIKVRLSSDNENSNNFIVSDIKQKIFIKVPILGRIRAGLPILASENWEGSIDLAEDIKADFALRVEGDSMSWVGICDGDLALFRQVNSAQQGEIVAVGVEDNEWCATLKYYIVENGIPLLRAANPNYPDMPMTPNHRIIGTLVCLQKEAPSINTYKSFLTAKELSDEHWNDVIEKATQYGLESKQLIQLIELFSHMVKHVK